MASLESAARHNRLLVLGGAITLGCAQMSGVDDYSVGPTQLKKEAEAAPRLPYLTGAACEACLAERCESQRLACQGDAFCSEWVDGMQTRPGPVAFYERHRAMRNEMWAGMHGALDRSVATVDLFECSSKLCFGPCALGRDFACAGNFDWANDPPPRRLRVSVENSYGPMPDTAWSVKACPELDVQCTRPLSITSTDARGLAEPTLPEPSEVVPELGFLLFGGPAEFHEWATIVSRPFVTDDYTPWIFTDRKTIDSWYELFQERFDPSYGYIWVVPADCQGLPAKGVELDVQLATADGPEPCDTCKYTYENDAGLPDPNPTNFSTAAKLAYASFVPPVRVMLRVRDSETKALVAIQNISVARGRIYFVRTYPPSAAELDAIPGAR